MCNTIQYKDVNYFISLIQVKFEDCLPSFFINLLYVKMVMAPMTVKFE